MLVPSRHNQHDGHGTPESYPPHDPSLDAVLDDFLRLAALTCGTPLAQVRLTGGRCRHFGERPGLEAGDADALAAFRADAPLIAQDGHSLGTLTVWDITPRQLAPAQWETLRLLARRAAAEVEGQQISTESARLQKTLTEREAHLLRSNSILQAQQEAAIDGILIVDENQRVVSYNRRFCELWGIPPGLAGGGDDRPVLRHTLAQMRDPEEFLGKVRALYDHPGESSRDELHLKDGRVFDRYSGPVVGEDGQDYGRIWYFRDITERVRAEEALRASEERLRTAVAGLPLILFVLDASAVITFSEGRGLNAVGVKPGEDVGKSMLELYAGYPDIQSAIRRALAGETVSLIQEFPGTVFETQFIPQCDETGETSGVIGVAVDVTERRWAEQQILNLNAELEDRLDRIVVLNLELAQAYEATIEGWSRALDLRDHETEGHSLRVTDLTLRLAEAFGLPDDVRVQVRRGALLHDIGKMGVPDAILLKPGPLTDEERAVMEEHPAFAQEMLAPIEFLHPALDIPYCHHEKWDGTGYPRGLRGEEIPLAARLFAVVDVWDALRSDRPYRRAWPEERVRAHIAALAGSHFDPHVVEVFLRDIAPAAHPHAENFSPLLRAA